MQKRTSNSNVFLKHMSEYRLYYIFIFVVFSLGILIGACTATSYKSESVAEVNGYFGNVSASVESGTSIEMFRKILLVSIKEAAIIWAFGFMIFGSVPILYVIFKRGFIIGVTVTLILNFFETKGILVSFVLMLFQSILYAPCLFFLAAQSIRLAAEFLDKLVSRSNYGFDLKSICSKYILILVGCIVVIILYSLLESFVSFNILKRCFIT